MTKRLFLFAAFDKFQHVDSTLMRFLNALSKLGDIAFVMDNELPDAEISKLKSVPNIKHINAARHNEYDFGSYKRGYVWARDNDLLDNYDWVYLVNDSVFGPVTDLEPVLVKMENRNPDFFGMVENVSPEYPKHIQSWFVGLSKRVAVSNVFNDFICGVKQEQEKIIVVYKYEIRLSVVLAQNGFSCDAVYHDGIDVNILNNPWRVLDGGVPFLKKQSFNYNDNVLSLYQFLSNDWLSEVFAYTKTYGIWETNTGSDSVYKKVFRMSLFGIPIVTLRRKRNQWKAYLFDFIPVMKISL